MPDTEISNIITEQTNCFDSLVHEISQLVYGTFRQNLKHLLGFFMMDVSSKPLLYLSFGNINHDHQETY